jgi:glucokinase
MNAIIAVDAGGTRLRAATYKPDQLKPLTQKKIETQADEPNVLDRLIRLIEDVMPKDKSIGAISVSAPGPIDPQTGVVMNAPNVKEWRDFPLGAKLAERFGVPVYLGNDANLAGLAEWKFGAGRGHHNVLYLTVSTGVGGGVIMDDQLLLGHRGLAAELGHVTLEADGPLCGCGQRGHLESFSSGTGIKRYVAERLQAGRESVLLLKQDRGEKISARDISKAAMYGDPLSIEAYQIAGKYLGIGVAGFLHAFDPSILIFGGGVSFSGAELFDPFEESLQARVMHPRYLEGLVIAKAELGDDAGLLGARALAELKTG